MSPLPQMVNQTVQQEQQRPSDDSRGSIVQHDAGPTPYLVMHDTDGPRLDDVEKPESKEACCPPEWVEWQHGKCHGGAEGLIYDDDLWVLRPGTGDDMR